MSNIITDILNVNIDAIKQKFTIGINKIPSTIGNNILILNSSIVTHDYVSTIFKVNLLGRSTPYNLVSIILEELDRKGLKYILDYKFHLKEKVYSSKDRELIDTHKIGWNALLRDFQKSVRDKAQWGIDTADTLLNKQSYKGDFVIKLSCPNGLELTEAIDVVESCLSSTGSYFYRGTFTLAKLLQEFTTMSNSQPSGQTFPLTAEEVARVSPIPMAKSDKGLVFGVSVETNEVVSVPLNDMGDQARNILVLAGTGSGKTMIVTQICQTCVENGDRLFIYDLKGNEFITLTKAVGGISVNLTDMSRSYINSIHRIPDRRYDSKTYFEEMDNLLTDTLLAISSYEGCNESQNRIMITSFIRWLWLVIGVSKDNPNSWKNSLQLTMNSLMDYFNQFYTKYLTSAKFSEKELRDYELQRSMLSMYLDRSSQYSYIWEEPINLDELLNSNSLHLNFGIFEGATVNQTLFILRWKYANYLKSKYLMYNYRSGIRTDVVMEEAQQVSAIVREAYSERWTTGRSQATNNFLLTNSFDTLKGYNEAPSFLNNIKFLMCSKQSKDLTDYLCSQLDINDLKPKIESLADSSMNHCFFLWSKDGYIQPTIIKAQILDERVYGKAKVFKPV